MFTASGAVCSTASDNILVVIILSGLFFRDG